MRRLILNTRRGGAPREAAKLTKASSCPKEPAQEASLAHCLQSLQHHLELASAEAEFLLQSAPAETILCDLRGVCRTLKQLRGHLQRTLF